MIAGRGETNRFIIVGNGSLEVLLALMSKPLYLFSVLRLSSPTISERKDAAYPA